MAQGYLAGKARGGTICQGIEASGWPQESPEASRSHANWNRAWERPFCVPMPCLLPQHREPRNKGAILSYLMLPSPTGSARWQGHQGVSIHYPPPTPKSSGAECWGGGCSMLCCHSNQPNPQLQSTQKRALTPISRRNLGLPGNLS